MCCCLTHPFYIPALFSVYSCFSSLYCLLDLQCPASSVFQYLQCSCIFRVPVSSEADRSRPYCRSFSLMEDCLQISWLRLLISSPAWRGHHELRCPFGRSAVDTSWPNTLEVSLGPKAEQDRQESSNWSLVNIRLQFTTQCLPCPRHCGLSRRGSFTFVQRDVAPLPLGQLFCVSVTKLTWPPLLWSSQGVDFTNQSLLQKEDLEDPLLPLGRM